MTTVSEADLLGRWFPFQTTGEGVRLYCLPHAGGSASAFSAWSGRIAGATVCPVEPPGRQTRIKEPLLRSMDAFVAELADAVLAAGEERYAVYGHSLGGLVGFELVREIRRRGGIAPRCLVVSGCSAPDNAPAAWPSVADLGDDEMVEVLRRLGGTPEWVLSDPSVLRLILPPFRGDFSIKESHRYVDEPPLAVPITVIAATDDPQAPLETMDAWRAQTNRRFRSHVLRGGHFAALQQAALTHQYIGAALRH